MDKGDIRNDRGNGITRSIRVLDSEGKPYYLTIRRGLVVGAAPREEEPKKVSDG